MNEKFDKIKFDNFLEETIKIINRLKNGNTEFSIEKSCPEIFYEIGITEEIKEKLLIFCTLMIQLEKFISLYQ